MPGGEAFALLVSSEFGTKTERFVGRGIGAAAVNSERNLYPPAIQISSNRC